MEYLGSFHENLLEKVAGMGLDSESEQFCFEKPKFRFLISRCGHILEGGRLKILRNFILAIFEYF